MKNIILLVCLLFITKAFSQDFKVMDLCENKAIVHENFKLNTSQSVGKITIDIFNKLNIPYTGHESSINSIFNSPTGFDSYEVISDTEMKVYGWCFEVDGIQPDVLASEYLFNISSHKNITWFFGFAHYLNGEWITYCTPSYEEPSPFICP